MRKLEKVDERKFATKVVYDGNECIKIKRRHWPDRLVVINHGRCFYIEFKRAGEDPREGQLLIHAMLQKKGHSVYVCETYEEALEIYREELELCSKKVPKYCYQLPTRTIRSRTVPGSRTR